jgi:hypothetical protein
LSRRAIENIVARREDRLITECGCVVLPPALAIMGHMVTECREHGEQVIVRKATPRETMNWDLGLPLNHTTELPENPPF